MSNRCGRPAWFLLPALSHLREKRGFEGRSGKIEQKAKEAGWGDGENSRCQRSKMAVKPRPPGAAEGGAERPLAPTSQMIQTSGDGTAQGLPGEREGEPLRSSIQAGPAGCGGQ